MIWRFTFCLVVCASAAIFGQPSFGQQNDYGAVLKRKAELERQLNEIESEFRSALPEHKAEIRDRHRAIDQKLSDLIKDLRIKALEQYRAAPNEDNQIVQILLNIALYDYEHDNAVHANETLQLLLENGCRIRGIYDLAGMAAFRSNEYEKAKSYFKTAEKNGTLGGDGRRMGFVLDNIKKSWEVEKAIREKEAEADDLPRIKLQTTKGDIILELFENEAPQTVANYINLVEKGFYDGLLFHRVQSGFMAQGGDPNGDGSGGPGYRIYCECYGENARKHFAGSLAMAHAGPNTGGSQFYITYVPTPHLDGEHTVFGRVVDGMDAVARLNKGEVPGGFQHDLAPDKVIKATVLRKRDHAYAPTTVE